MPGGRPKKEVIEDVQNDRQNVEVAPVEVVAVGSGVVPPAREAVKKVQPTAKELGLAWDVFRKRSKTDRKARAAEVLNDGSN